MSSLYSIFGSADLVMRLRRLAQARLAGCLASQLRFCEPQIVNERSEAKDPKTAHTKVWKERALACEFLHLLHI